MGIDWDAGHGPFTGTASAALASLAAAYAGNLAHLPPVYGVGVAGGGLLATLAAKHNMLGRAASWLVAGGWCAWSFHTGPWHGANLAVLGIGAATAAAYHHHRANDPAPAPAEPGEDPRWRLIPAAQRTEIAREWEERLERVTGVAGAQVVGVEIWDTGSGYTLDVDLPTGGVTWKRVQVSADGLASDARLPEGCAVEVLPGQNRGSVILNVATTNALVDDLPYPDDYSELSVNEPAPIGKRRDGRLYELVMRQLSALIVGQRGSGKTNLLHVMIANQLRMVDSITWVIDLNGGGVALKWLRTWHALGKPGPCPIDWIADTPAKALAMATALVAVAKARKVEYQHLEIEADDDKLPVTAKVPEIRVLNDEGAEIFSSRSRADDILRQIGGLLVQVVEIARAAAVNQTTTGLRATQDVIADPQILKQSALKIGMRVADESEMRYFFGNNFALPSPEDAPYPGCAQCQAELSAIEAVKIYRFRPSQIAAIIKATKDRHPVLDEVSVRAAGQAYQDRWNDTDHLFGIGLSKAGPATGTALLDKPTTPPTTLPPFPIGSSGSASSDWDSLPLPPDPGGQGLDALADRMQDAETGKDADLEREFWDTVNGGGLGWTPPSVDGPPLPPTAPAAPPTDDRRWPIVLRMVHEAGTDGITPTAVLRLWEQYGDGTEAPARSAVSEWLNRSPMVRQPGGPRSPYIHVDHLPDGQ